MHFSNRPSGICSYGFASGFATARSYISHIKPIVGRGFLTPLFYEDSPFFKFCPTPPLYLQPPPPMLFLLSNFFDWMGCRATFDVLFYLVILCIYSCWVSWYLCNRRTLLCFIQQDVKFTEVWHIMQFLAGTLIWYHTDTQTKTYSTFRGPINWHTHKNIY